MASVDFGEYVDAVTGACKRATGTMCFSDENLSCARVATARGDAAGQCKAFGGATTVCVDNISFPSRYGCYSDTGYLGPGGKSA